ncbi:hypothetical protein [Enhygromyxa salina]|uniref:Transposase IS200-like domain-containing protein n=1 Tax=Enhygromyxa salina TaxID=215803 RepID=A0A2S9YCB2_9BACT|nr:hypothetical protein [Enhygromyxa salina]PRQ02733.1 hypothetical protein ENSA7_55620 [Enhygromyxa salina]
MATSEQKQASAARRAKNRARGQARDYPRVRARPIYPGSRYKVNRRCAGQLMMFAPEANPTELNNLIGYCLARAAALYGVQIHASLWMSNHHHTDITDPDANFGAFKQLLHSLIARGRNAQLVRDDSVWSGARPCDTQRPADDHSLVDLVYTLTNPVKDGLVKWARLWPGFTTIGWRFGETRTFKRPDCLFDEEGDMPEELSLTLVRPPVHPELDDDALYDKLMAEVRQRELEIQRSMAAQNRRFMGLTKLARQSWNKAPKTFKKRFTVAPKHAASIRELVLAQLPRDREWEKKYAAARALLLAGKPALFPAGTYWMRRFAGVDVAPQAP